MLPFGLLTGLGAALAWGMMDVAGALASRRLGSLRVVAGTQVVSAVLLIVGALATGARIPNDPGVLVAAALLGIAGAGAYLAYFTGLRIGPIAIVSGMVAAYGGLTVVLAVLLRGETLTALQAFGAAVATVGVVATGVAFDGSLRGLRFAGPGVGFAIVALILFAVMTVGLAGVIETAGWLEVIVVSRLVNAAVSVAAVLVVSRVRHPVIRPLVAADAPPSRRTWAIVVVAGVLDGVGLVSLAIGLETAPTWLVGLASSFGPAVTIVVAVVFLGERLRPIQWVGLAGIAAGMIGIALP
jgi:drug/metabolite transporter (DMT)-like permease